MLCNNYVRTKKKMQVFIERVRNFTKCTLVVANIFFLLFYLCIAKENCDSKLLKFDQATRITLKTGDELGCSEMVLKQLLLNCSFTSI